MSAATRMFTSLACAAALALAGSPSFAQKRADEGSFPALAELEREVSRLMKENEGSVVSIVARLKLEEILKGMGDEVRIAAEEAEMARRVGSGVVIDGAGHIATTASVVYGATDIVIVPGGGGTKRRARIRGVDNVSGIAILAPEQTSGLRPIRMADAPAPVGAMVTGFGNPGEDGPAYSFGFVTGTGIQDGPWRTGSFMKINAPTLPGAAGGPLFDTKGRLVGLVFGGGPRRSVIRWRAHGEGRAAPEEDLDPETMALLDSLHRHDAGGGSFSYAVPVDTLRHVADQIIASGTVRRGWMGVTIETPEDGQVVLTRVVPHSPASKAGLVQGDRVVALDGRPLPSAEALVEHIARSAPGDVVRLSIVRDDRRSDVSVPLGERPEPGNRRDHRIVHVRKPAPLGVRIEPVEERMLEIPGIPEGTGLVILQVTEASRAALAGLSEGDILVEALGIPLRSLSDLRNALTMQAEEQPMSVKVVRDGEVLVVTVPPPPPPPPRPGPAPRAPRPPRPRGN